MIFPFLSIVVWPWQRTMATIGWTMEGHQMDVGGDKLSDKHAKGTNEAQVFP
jgi:hypothetical protein